MDTFKRRTGLSTSSFSNLRQFETVQEYRKARCGSKKRRYTRRGKVMSYSAPKSVEAVHVLMYTSIAFFLIAVFLMIWGFSMFQAMSALQQKEVVEMGMGL